MWRRSCSYWIYIGLIVHLEHCDDIALPMVTLHKDALMTKLVQGAACCEINFAKRAETAPPSFQLSVRPPGHFINEILSKFRVIPCRVYFQLPTTYS